MSENDTTQQGARSGAIERIVFFGTPRFAVPTLDALADAGRRPALVVSQPTRAAGRGRRPSPPPVASWALERGVDLVQTERVADPEFLERLRSLRPDLAVVVAFGQIFRRPLLELPRLGCVNVHASLLPAWRGASPIAAAIRAGETITGVSTMVMERGLDSGPILLQRELAIGPDETTGELTPRLAALGAELLVETLDTWERTGLAPRSQDDGQATYAPMLERGDGVVHWGADARAIHDLVRAMSPWPGTRSSLRGEVVSVRRSALPGKRADGAPGEVLGVEGDALRVVAGDGGVVDLLELQRPGRKALRGRDFANGERLDAGECFEPMPAGAPDG